LHLVVHLYNYTNDARTHERQLYKTTCLYLTEQWKRTYERKLQCSIFPQLEGLGYCWHRDPK